MYENVTSALVVVSALRRPLMLLFLVWRDIISPKVIHKSCVHGSVAVSIESAVRK